MFDFSRGFALYPDLKTLPDPIAGYKGATSDWIEACLLLKTTSFFSVAPAVMIIVCHSGKTMGIVITTATAKKHPAGWKTAWSLVSWFSAKSLKLLPPAGKLRGRREWWQGRGKGEGERAGGVARMGEGTGRGWEDGIGEERGKGCLLLNGGLATPLCCLRANELWTRQSWLNAVDFTDIIIVPVCGRFHRVRYFSQPTLVCVFSVASESSLPTCYQI